MLNINPFSWAIVHCKNRMCDGTITSSVVGCVVLTLLFAIRLNGQELDWERQHSDLFAALKLLEDGFAGKTVECEQSYINGRDESVKSSRVRVSMSADRQFLRETFWGYNQELDEMGEFVNPDKTVTHRNERCCFWNQEIWIRQNLWNGSSNGSGSQHGSISGKMHLPPSHRFSILFPGHLGGYCGDDRIPFTEILAMPNARFAVTSATYGDEPAKKYSVDVPGMGVYEFVVAGEVPLVRSMSIQKVRIGEIIDKDWTGGWAVERAGDGRETIVNSIDYKNEDDRWIPASESFTLTTTRSGKKEKGGNLVTISVTSISDFSIKDNSRAWFEEIPVKNGMPVTVAGKEGLAYSYVDGRIVRGIDHESIAVIDGVRVRKPTGSRWKWYVFGGVGVVVLVGIFLYARRPNKS